MFLGSALAHVLDPSAGMSRGAILIDISSWKSSLQA